MTLGLRSRLLLLVGSVVVASLVLVALYSGEVANRAYLEVSAESEFAGPAVDIEGLGTDLSQRFDPADPGDWAADLTALAEPLSKTHWLLAFDRDRRFVAASDPALDDARIMLDESGELSVERRVVDASGIEAVENLTVLAPLLTLADDAGMTSAYLTAIPIPGTTDPAASERRQVFRSSLGRNLLVGVAAIGVLALLATHLVGVRVLGPIEALTRGARRMARGDFEARVEVQRGDELGELATAFNDMAGGLAAIERWRQQMLNDTAHELRTPLTNLRCRIEAMEDGLAPTDAEQVAALGSDVQRLARLVDDLRDLSLAEAGQLELQPEPLRVGELLTGVLASPALGDAPIAVERSGDDRLRADPGRLQQILTNLLINAQAHGAGARDVRVRVVGEADAVQVHVEDRGPGLPGNEIPRLFERFHRAGDARGGGTGLGLAIVRQLAQAHGGDVEAANRPGGGARFSVRLPRSSDR